MGEKLLMLVSGHYCFANIGKGDFELYDIKNDPDEWVSLTNDPKYKGVAEQLKTNVEGTV